MRFLGCAGCHSGCRCGGTEAGVGVNWGCAGKDARGPKCLPARSFLVVPVYRSPAQPPLPTRPGGEGVHTAQILLGRGAPWERRRPRRHFFTSNEKSLHCECASLVVRAVIQAVVVAGLRLAWELIGDVRAGMPADRRCLPARNASLVSAYRSPPPAASYNKTRGRRLSHGANLARAGHPLGPRASLPAVPSRAM